MRHYCAEALIYGDKTQPAHQPFDKILVILNPLADKRSAAETVCIGNLNISKLFSINLQLIAIFCAVWKILHANFEPGWFEHRYCENGFGRPCSPIYRRVGHITIRDFMCRRRWNVIGNCNRLLKWFKNRLTMKIIAQKQCSTIFNIYFRRYLQTIAEKRDASGDWRFAGRSWKYICRKMV